MLQIHHKHDEILACRNYRDGFEHGTFESGPRAGTSRKRRRMARGLFLRSQDAGESWPLRQLEDDTPEGMPL